MLVNKASPNSALVATGDHKRLHVWSPLENNIILRNCKYNSFSVAGGLTIYWRSSHAAPPIFEKCHARHLIWVLISSSGAKVCICVREDVRTASSFSVITCWVKLTVSSSRVCVGKECGAHTVARIPSVGRAASEIRGTSRAF